MHVRVPVQIPGPGAHKTVDLNVYKLRPPKYSMTANHPPPGDHMLKPGPGSHYPEKVFSLFNLCVMQIIRFSFLWRANRNPKRQCLDDVTLSSGSGLIIYYYEEEEEEEDGRASEG